MLLESLVDKNLVEWTPEFVENVTDNGLTLTAELPNFNKKNIKECKVDQDGFLVVEGERKTVVKATGERRVRAFYYSADIDGYDPETLTCTVENGKLTITLNKSS